MRKDAAKTAAPRRRPCRLSLEKKKERRCIQTNGPGALSSGEIGSAKFLEEMAKRRSGRPGNERKVAGADRWRKEHAKRHHEGALFETKRAIEQDEGLEGAGQRRARQ